MKGTETITIATTLKLTLALLLLSVLHVQSASSAAAATSSSASRTSGASADSYLLVPLPAMSHCLEMAAVGRELEAKGHRVYLLAPDYFHVDKCVKGRADKVKVLKFAVDPELGRTVNMGMDQSMNKMSEDNNPLHLVNALATIIPSVCRSFAQARPFLDKFRDGEEKVKMVVIDGLFFGRCLTLIPAYLSAPYALIGSFLVPFDSGAPSLATSYPYILTSLPGKMGFLQRVANTLLYASLRAFTFLIESKYDQGDDFGPELSSFDYGRAMRRADLYLENSDYILDYPKASFPNFVQVGGLTTGPPKPLPADLQTWMDGAKNEGVVVVSLGSMLFNASVQTTDTLLSAASMVKAKVLLRLNVRNSRVSVAKSVKPVDWFPQNDVLGHPNTKLFISHCGKNGFFEGLYHGVPILCVPFNADGFGTGSRVKLFGVGDSLDLAATSAQDLATTINRILQDSGIHQRMKRLSALFHDRPEPAAKRAATALEHVVKYGGAHLRPTTTELSYWQENAFDVHAFLCALILLSFVCFFYFCRLLIRVLRRLCCGSSKLKSE